MEEREKALEAIKAAERSKASLAIIDVASRLWEAKAQYDVTSNATETNLNRLVDYFGETTLLTEIDQAEAEAMVAWRRSHHVERRGKLTKAQKEALPLVSNATTNRSVTAVLQRLFAFAKAEGAVFDREPKWRKLMLKEPVERVRELQDHEAEALNAAMRDDLLPFFAFAHMTGMRLKECALLRWSEVNFGTRQIVKTGKGDRRVVVQITDSVREILFPLQGQHLEFVFTYVVAKGNRRLGRIRGQRYPLTLTGVKSAWQRLRARANVTDFRLHDYRHDFGSKLLRDTGNVKLVQRALNHADIRSTLRYAHVRDDEVADASERVGSSFLQKYRRLPGKLPAKVRKVG
jgi:integrase